MYLDEDNFSLKSRLLKYLASASYPPGVPIVFPGDTIDESIREQLNSYKEKGFLIVSA